MLRFLPALISMFTDLGRAFRHDSDGGGHLTHGELRDIGGRVAGFALDALDAPIGVGDQVLVRIGGTDADPTLRPAVVVCVWGETVVNLQVFLDGTNDAANVRALTHQLTAPVCILWQTSVSAGFGVGEWRRYEHSTADAPHLYRRAPRAPHVVPQ